MHEIIFYEDSSGKNPVREYMRELEKSKSKDSRIKLNKINDYIQALSVYGVAELSENYVKHLDGEIWELRQSVTRILFAWSSRWAVCAASSVYETDTENACQRD